ncbi:hypothetical protein [Herbaspirillum seropedicae]|uniref:hypothetical protein n=1 Tax=Herbaspirillum seropedicae TaxID=964 RepID=UPI000847FE4C|nr:hypothetical protein [Herbaspirillum seropedicae]AON53788.1 hypothetical protein Hsc_1485 [Herbaspirillum seropedicae]
MINNETTPVVLEVARLFVRLVQGTTSAWNKAYLRLQFEDGNTEAKGSYVAGNDVEIIDAIKNKVFFRPIGRLGGELFSHLGKNAGLFLLTINDQFEYEFQFEYADMNRWGISKLNGGTGIPS